MHTNWNVLIVYVWMCAMSKHKMVCFSLLCSALLSLFLRSQCSSDTNAHITMVDLNLVGWSEHAHLVCMYLLSGTMLNVNVHMTNILVLFWDRNQEFSKYFASFSSRVFLFSYSFLRLSWIGTFVKCPCGTLNFHCIACSLSIYKPQYCKYRNMKPEVDCMEISGKLNRCSNALANKFFFEISRKRNGESGLAFAGSIFPITILSFHS